MAFEGIILIDKPKDFTSFDVVAKMRGIAGTKKVGHGGTLDPMATGVLPIFFGRAAKACDILPNQDKNYRATVRLGISTDTQDITGTVLKSSDNIPNLNEVIKLLPSFAGKQEQLPPMYSAIRVDGQRLYDLARQGIEIERKPRDIEIYSIDYISGSNTDFIIDVSCSKGSYIRTLCHDIGEKLGCGATLTDLRRTVASGFNIADCITLEEAQELKITGKLEDRLISVSNVFKNLTPLVMSDKDCTHFLNGVKFTAKRFNINSSTGDIAIYTENGDFLGISYVDEMGMLICKKQFVLR